MNLTEKLNMVHGWGGPYVGDVPANSRLNIPRLTLEDGPQGVADGVTSVTGEWDVERREGVSSKAEADDQ